MTRVILAVDLEHEAGLVDTNDWWTRSHVVEAIGTELATLVTDRVETVDAHHENGWWARYRRGVVTVVSTELLGPRIEACYVRFDHVSVPGEERVRVVLNGQHHLLTVDEAGYLEQRLAMATAKA